MLKLLLTLPFLDALVILGLYENNKPCFGPNAPCRPSSPILYSAYLISGILILLVVLFGKKMPNLKYLLWLVVPLNLLFLLFALAIGAVGFGF